MKAKTVKEVLIAAKWILEHVGWTQRESVIYGYEGKPIAYCASGAISAVETDQSRSLKGEAERTLKKAMDYASFICDWNDRFGRTKEEVIAAFDKAIKLSEEP